MGELECVPILNFPMWKFKEHGGLWFHLNLETAEDTGTSPTKGLSLGLVYCPVPLVYAEIIPRENIVIYA